MSVDYLLEHNIEDDCSIFSIDYEIEDDGTDKFALEFDGNIFADEEILLESSEGSFNLP